MKYIVVACGILYSVFIGMIVNNLAASPQTKATVAAAWKNMSGLIGLGDPREDRSPILRVLENLQSLQDAPSGDAQGFSHLCQAPSGSLCED
jgi:hypothetical protein